MKRTESISRKKDFPWKKPAVFLDRDGVLTREKSYVRSIQELEIFPYAEECISKIREKGYYTIVVTNQSGQRIFYRRNAALHECPLNGKNRC